MKPLSLVETTPGKFSLLLNAGTTAVDDTISELGHEPNGYFWEGVASILVEKQAPEIADGFSYDPEAGMFCAYGTDKSALEKLVNCWHPSRTIPIGCGSSSSRRRPTGSISTTDGADWRSFPRMAGPACQADRPNHRDRREVGEARDLLTARA